ncbi:unnamed protein product [Aureobasidium mustum]|uniref:Uncharacterized protein n=1 Tax=Aureobasidium mustum TaxID=2773714 RepID=A0A9N8JJ48_9PEZI|nr:unnamed protein product [Aureobasidium mustum]
MEDVAHTAYLYQEQHHCCPFGCQKEFLNDFALHRHIQECKCENVEDFSQEIQSCKHCHATFPDVIGALNHSEQAHNALTASHASQCRFCNIEFLVEELYRGHIALQSKRGDAHPMVTKAQGLRYPQPELRQVS